jgi:poly-gamma-glutamate synthesis protein (capsule biosynthesis protein)
MAGSTSAASPSAVTLFLCGDVMTGRGIDQILQHPSRPQLHESYVTDARDYVALAGRMQGAVHAPVKDDYIWGSALAELNRRHPDVRLINLETSVTTSAAFWPGKGIHYRMHPKNIGCLTAAKIDGCVLANNHVMDWGKTGLVETLETLQNSAIKTVGAGKNQDQAKAPAIFNKQGKGRIMVWAYGSPSSGIPRDWNVSPHSPGVNYLPDLGEHTLQGIVKQIQARKKPGDLAVFSVHWGTNWGYEITDEQVWFAHELIDRAGVDIVHGHSSHHVQAVEIYHGKPILYGCGDFLNDYEGIQGFECFRGDLGAMYFITMEPDSGQLQQLVLVPTQIKGFQVQRPQAMDVDWFYHVVRRECAKFNTGVERHVDGSLTVTALT